MTDWRAAFERELDRRMELAGRCRALEAARRGGEKWKGSRMTPDDALDAARAAAAASEARGETWQGWTAAELAEQRRNEAMGFQRESNPGEAERAARNAAASPVPAGWSGAERADSLAPHILAERKAHEGRIAELESAVSGLTIALAGTETRRDEAIAHAKRCEEARYEEQERRKRAEEALAQARRELSDFRAAEEARVKAERERPAARPAWRGVREAAKKAVAAIKGRVEQKAGRPCDQVWGAPRLEETETLREVAMHVTLLERALADEERAGPFADESEAELLEALKPSERPVSERARLIYEGAVRLAAADTDPRTGEPRVRSGERCAETYVADAACFFDAAFGTVEDEAASERAAGGNGGAA